MKTHLNLLPPAFRRRQLLTQRLRQWLLVWGLAAGLALLVGGGEWTRLKAQSARWKSLQRHYAPIETMYTELPRLEKEIEDLQRREALVLQLAQQQSGLTLLGVISRAARQGEGKVSVERLALQQRAVAAPGQEGSDTVLTLQGTGLDNLAVAHFVAALRDSEAFDHVQLKSTGSQVLGTAQVRSYSLECSY